MTDEEKVDEFVEKLSKCDVTFKNSVENMYANNVDGHENTVTNLKLYLKKMLEIKPKYLLVGEAPGYKGCRWSGIPFTSEEILDTSSFFGDKFKFRKSPEKENTAKSVWSYLDSKKIYPLMWNAFPFHPHKDGDENSNRAPNKQEIEFGKGILHELMQIFKIDLNNVIAVGRKAEKSLNSFSDFKNENLKVKEVRHPSHGGKDEFIEGLKDYLK